MTKITINGADVEWPAKTISCGQICEIVEMPYDFVVRYKSDGRVVHPEQFIEVCQGHSFTVESKHAVEIECPLLSMAPGDHRKGFIDDIIGGPEDFPGSDF